MKTSKLPKYKYTRLSSPDCVRVVSLLPTSDDEGDIDCEIVEISLNDKFDDDHDDYRKREKIYYLWPSLTFRHTIEMPVSYKSRPYEALSWCWGQAPADQVLRVHGSDDVFGLLISPTLRNALLALRRQDKKREVWIDAICINQKDTEERNEQVARMGEVYGKARHVCVWLGDSSSDSKLAIQFIKEQVVDLWRFDELIENGQRFARQWAALSHLMHRPWFSRRWVIQEIVLSPHGKTIYCGRDSISWEDFADAVELFVEVESFKDLSLSGAAFLVDAKSKIFPRDSMPGERRPISSLEFLVSRLLVFEATQPRDTIYALLSLARETAPRTGPTGRLVNKAYKVDYRLPVIDVYQEFIEFSILKADKTRALDILCRAWAPIVMEGHDDPNFLKFGSEKNKKREQEQFKKENAEGHNNAQEWEEEWNADRDREIPLPSWIQGLWGAAFEMEEHPIHGVRMQRQNADPLVGLPDESGRRNYSAGGDTEVDLDMLEFRKWNTLKKPNSSYPEYSLYVRGFVLDEVATVERLATNGNMPYQWLQAGGWHDTQKYPPEEFWRTMVADRTHDGHNSPIYFPRACKESMKYRPKRMPGTAGGNFDCNKMISDSRSTIVARFLRRVQVVIWNRKLMRTKRGSLGLVRNDVTPGFKVCILYGCSVPVILQEIQKRPAEREAELIDRYNQWYRKVEIVVSFCEARYRLIIERRKKEEKSREIECSDRGEEAKVSKPGETLTSRQQIQSWLYMETQAPNKEQTIEIKPTSIHKSRGSSGDLFNEEFNSKQADLKTHHGIKKAKVSKLLTRKEREAEIDRGEKEFEAGKRRQKEKIAQDVQENLSYYRLVGECYVHGIMNGEAINLQKEQKLADQVFELR